MTPTKHDAEFEISPSRIEEPGLMQVHLKGLSNPATVGSLMREMKARLATTGLNKILVSIDGSFPALGGFPNVAVPLAALLERLRAHGVEVSFQGTADGSRRFTFVNPDRYDSRAGHAPDRVLNKVFRFDEESQFKLLKALVRDLAQNSVAAAGVLDALEWSLGEILDNVIQHSGVDHGFVMAQRHASRNFWVLCIADNGQGIFNSFEGSDTSPVNRRDSLFKAIQRGVTRNRRTNQGNGLWGSTSLVLKNGGTFSLISSGHRLLVETSGQRDNEVSAWDEVCPGTVVDIQLNIDSVVNFREVFEDGFRPWNIAWSGIEGEPGEENIISISETFSDLSTRFGGEKARNLVLNFLSGAGEPVVLDFEGITIVSSSFADELLGKLFLELGPVSALSLVKLRNLNPQLEVVINRAIMLRMKEGGG